MNWRVIFVVSAVFFGSLCVLQGADTTTSLHTPTVSIPTSLFGMHIHHMLAGAAQPTPWPAIPFGTWRLWDAYAAWPSVESEKGKWNFANVDKYVSIAEEHQVEILMPLALSPAWASSRPEEKSGYSPGNAAEPRDLNDWRNYVRTVATRYKGRVHAYEIWNEPNLKNFYTGSPAQLVQLVSVAYQALKGIDPAIIVCSPAFTEAIGLSMFEQYLNAGGARYADVIGYHLYVSPGPPEEMVGLIQQIREKMTRNGAANKPLWNTESGWEIQNKQSVVKQGLSPEEAASYLARAFVLSWASGVSRFYWYSWDNYASGLVDHDGKTLKSPAIAYGEIQKWLIGAWMDSCDTDANGTWTCAISRDGGYRGWIVWNPARTLNLTLPGSWKVKQVRDLAGKTELPRPGSPSIPIGPSPVLLESQVP